MIEIRSENKELVSTLQPPTSTEIETFQSSAIHFRNERGLNHICLGRLFQTLQRGEPTSVRHCPCKSSSF